MPVKLDVVHLGCLEYGQALEAQKRRLEERIAGRAEDALFLVEHPAVLTQGRSGEEADVLASAEELRRGGVEIFHVERGGRVTFHGPGQLVAYPVILLRERDLHEYLRKLLDVVASVLRAFGLTPELSLHGPGVWVDGAKIGSVGVAVRKWTTFHGISINVSTDLNFYQLINPCGFAGERVTSLQRELAKNSLDCPGMEDVQVVFTREFRRVFGYEDEASPRGPERPSWLRVTAPAPGAMDRVERLLDRLELETVCQRADCPNIGECFSAGTSTFMILGAVCTRRCRYCAVGKGAPAPVDPGEPERVARAVQTLQLRHAVITSVTRDDLPDGGAEHFVRVIEAVRSLCPGVSVEVLVPDFAGDPAALRNVCRARPSVFNHNMETVRRLFPVIRPRADYDRSLTILRRAADEGLSVKSGIMLGLGETEEEIAATLADVRDTGCRSVTLGQYLAPGPAHQPVARYIPPEEFARWAEQARSLGFSGIASGPLVRSSYHARELYESKKGDLSRTRQRTLSPLPLHEGAV
jgi:lipoic acid synthetase